MNEHRWPEHFHADASDLRLFEQVRRSGLALPTGPDAGEVIDSVVRRHGLDFATALVYLSLYDVHRTVAEAVRHAEDDETAEKPLVLIVPGAFHLHHNHTGANARRLIRVTDQLGWPSDVLPVPSLGPIDANATALIERLEALRGRRLIVVSLSKGSADVAAALRSPRGGQAFGRVDGWLSISGMCPGTHLVDRVCDNPIRKLVVRLLLRLNGVSFEPLAELSRRRMLARPVDAPAGLRILHVVGVPLSRHLCHKWSPRGYKRLSPLGPNDGGGILHADAFGLPGDVFPVWGVDHYMDPPWDFGPVVRNLLLHTARSAAAASATPAGRSSA